MHNMTAQGFSISFSFHNLIQFSVHNIQTHTHTHILHGLGMLIISFMICQKLW